MKGRRILEARFGGFGIVLGMRAPMPRLLTACCAAVLWGLAVVAFVASEAAWFAHPRLDRADSGAIESYLFNRIDEAVSECRVGCAALVLLRNREVVAAHGFGVANAETGSPVTPDRTLFLVASVSKAVTALGVMRLVEEGRISLDEPVIYYLKTWRFPQSGAYSGRVTARHLLSHTAGLDDGLGYGGFASGEAVQTVEESLAWPRDSTVGPAKPAAVTREPGTAMAYSGAGYAVLQLLIEAVTEQPFAEHMQTTVLRPLGMESSSFDLDALSADGRSQDLASSYDATLGVQPHRRYSVLAPVALRATALDLARLALALMGENRVLGGESLGLMMTPQPGTGGSWGLGLELSVPNGADGRIVGHSGGTLPAWGAVVRVNPATGNGFVLTSSGGQGALNRLVHDWIYWETGAISNQARLQVVQDRIKPAAWAAAIGWLLIAGWHIRGTLTRRRAADASLPAPPDAGT